MGRWPFYRGGHSDRFDCTTNQKDWKLLTLLNMMDVQANFNLSKHSTVLPEGTSEPHTFCLRQAIENPNQMV